MALENSADTSMPMVPAIGRGSAPSTETAPLANVTTPRRGGPAGTSGDADGAAGAGVSAWPDMSAAGTLATGGTLSAHSPCDDHRVRAKPAAAARPRALSPASVDGCQPRWRARSALCRADEVDQ